jgi:hypothetical protein
MQVVGGPVEQGRKAQPRGDLPPWLARPWNERLTFFELLGVPEEASPSDINEAFGSQLGNAQMDEGRLPPGVKYAAEFLLASDGQRAFYRTLLGHCRTRQPIQVPPEDHSGIRNFSEAARLKCWSNPDDPDEFHVRLAGQEPPSFVTEALKREEARRAEDARRSERTARRQRHEQHSVRRFFLRLGYAFAALLLIGFAVNWLFDGFFDRGLKVAKVIDEHENKTLETESREALTLAADALSELEVALSSLRETVQAELSVSLDGSTVPGELEAVLQTEPTVSAAWKNIRGAYDVRTEFDGRKRTKAAIERRVSEKTFLKADLESLREMNTWATAATAAIKSTMPHIQHVRAMLEAERFSRVGQESPKEP